MPGLLLHDADGQLSARDQELLWNGTAVAVWSVAMLY
jgi:hypothetical protein